MPKGHSEKMRKIMTGKKMKKKQIEIFDKEKSLSNGIEQYPQKIRYFSFGYAHEHEYKGKHLHNRVVVKITHPTPHFVMGIEFGVDWCNEYEDVPYFANQVYDWNTDTLTDVEM